MALAVEQGPALALHEDALLNGKGEAVLGSLDEHEGKSPDIGRNVSLAPPGAVFFHEQVGVAAQAENRQRDQHPLSAREHDRIVALGVAEFCPVDRHRISLGGKAEISLGGQRQPGMDTRINRPHVVVEQGHRAPASGAGRLTSSVDHRR
jgi:hypothetical protein